MVTWGAVKGVPQGTFVWTLNSSARRFILSGFGVQFVLAASELLSSNHFRRLAFLKVLPATTTPTRLLSALSRGHMGARCTLGFDLKPGPITKVTGPGLLGAAI